MNDLELDRLAARAGANIRDEADRIADSTTALAELLAGGEPGASATSGPAQAPTPTMLRLDYPGSIVHGGRRRWVPLAAAAAAVIALTGVAVAIRSDDSITTVDEPTPVATTATPLPTPTTATTIATTPDTNPAAPTTGPSTDAPTTPAPTVDSTVPPSTVPVDPLALFVPDDRPRTLDDLPRLLPTTLATGADRVERSEFESSDAGGATYHELWANTDADGRVDAVVQLTASADPGRVDLAGTEAATVAPWDEAGWYPMAPSYEMLGLHSPSGSARVWAIGLTRDDVATLASSLAAAPDGTVTLATLTDWTPIAQYWTGRGALRSVMQSGGDELRAEILLAAGLDTGTVSWLPADLDTVTLVDVDGAPGLLADDPDRPVLVWSPAAGVTATAGVFGSADELLEIVRSASVVDEATWLASTTEFVPPGDGCASMFC